VARCLLRQIRHVHETAARARLVRGQVVHEAEKNLVADEVPALCDSAAGIPAACSRSSIAFSGKVEK
jgi:hypothetical protein